MFFLKSLLKSYRINENLVGLSATDELVTYLICMDDIRKSFSDVSNIEKKNLSTEVKKKKKKESKLPSTC